MSELMSNPPSPPPEFAEHVAAIDARADGSDGAAAELDLEEAFNSESIEAGAMHPSDPQKFRPSGKNKAELELLLWCGVLRFYRYDNRSEIVAHCANPDHGSKCRLTRSVLPSEVCHRVGQGRPLGLAVAWLRTGLSGDFVGDSHVKARPFPSHAARTEAREWLKTIPGGDLFFKQERDQWPGEPEEPYEVP